MTAGVNIAVLVCCLVPFTARAQSGPANQLKHDRIYVFLLKGGSCISGELVDVEANGLTIHVSADSSHPQQETKVLAKSDLQQMGDGLELYYSARSSWADVQNAKIFARETLGIQLKSGKIVKGKPKAVTADAITIGQPFSTKTISKAEVESVTSIKLRPETAGFDLLLQEAAWVTVFTGEFYQRLLGLEGHVPVRLYDVHLPEDNSPGMAKCFPALETQSSATPQISEAK